MFNLIHFIMEEKKIDLPEILKQNAVSIDVQVELIVCDDNSFICNVRNPQRQVVRSITSLFQLDSYFQALLDSLQQGMKQNLSD